MLQERLGISYKDAAHWLYMAKLERVKKDQSMYMAFEKLKISTQETLKMAIETLSAINGVSTSQE